MEPKKFDLFSALYPGGVLFANRAAMERGDYKQLALVSPAGNIRLYAARDYIPADAWQQIESTANDNRQKTRERLRAGLYTGQPWQRDYFRGRILEEISNYTSDAAWGSFWSDYTAAADQDAKNAAIIAHYIANF